MKIYSDNSVTRDDLTAIDEKQNKQIKQLRLALIAGIVFNTLLTIGLFLL